MAKSEKSAKLPQDDSETKQTTTTSAIATASPSVDKFELIANLQATDALKNSKYLACSPNSSLVEAMEANSMGDEKFSFRDLPKAKIPTGGETTFKIESVIGATLTEEITGVLVYYGFAGVLWAYEKMQEGGKPLLVTNDLITAVQLSDDFGELDIEVIESCFKFEENGRKYYDWKKLPYNEWGSGKNGGRRCKEQRLLCILRPDEYAPIFIRIPPTSVSEVSNFIKKLTLQTQMPHYRAVVQLTLSKEVNNEGTPYSVVKIASKGAVSKEEGEFFKAVYTDSLGGAMRDAAETTDAEEPVVA